MKKRIVSILLCILLSICTFGLSGCRYLRSCFIKDPPPVEESEPKPEPEPEPEKKVYLDSLPVINIFTEDNKNIVSKEEYLHCTMSLSNALEEFCFENYTGQIRGRGNSSWEIMPKKSYKFQFVKSDINGKKESILGRDEAKTWTFIANYSDKSLLRNYMAYSIAAKLSDNIFTTSCDFVPLYLNGSYNGLYLLCEQVQSGKTRVNIKEDLRNSKTKALYDVSEVGYLIELDSRADGEGKEGREWFVSGGSKYAIKTPDTEDEDYTEAYVVYIKGYIDTCLSALETGTYEQVETLLDVDTFVDTYIVHELFNCKDCGQSSFYLNKDAGGKLRSGPVWDFDLSSGNAFNDTANGIKINEPDTVWAGEVNKWYKCLLGFDEFKIKVKNRLDEKKADILEVIDSCKDFAFEYSDDFEKNFTVWNILDKDIWPSSPYVNEIKTWKGQVDFLVKWLKDSLNFMSGYFTPVGV